MTLTEVDRTLLKRCLTQEPGAWKDFVDRFVGLFVHVVKHTADVRSVRVTEADIDDLVAEVFVAILASDSAVLRQFRGKASLATYLAVIARRVIVREMTRRRMAESFGHVQAHDVSIDQASATTSGPEDRLQNREEVQRLLDELPPKEAEIVRLYHLESKSYREISDQLGIAENSIGPTLYRAREHLRSMNGQA